MKLNRITTERLRAMLAATEREAEPGSVSVAILRRELERRERRAQTQRKVRHAR